MDVDVYDDENEERVEYEGIGEVEEVCDSFYIVEENYFFKYGGSVLVCEFIWGI